VGDALGLAVKDLNGVLVRPLDAKGRKATETSKK